MHQVQKLKMYWRDSRHHEHVENAVSGSIHVPGCSRSPTSHVPVRDASEHRHLAKTIAVGHQTNGDVRRGHDEEIFIGPSEYPDCLDLSNFWRGPDTVSDKGETCNVSSLPAQKR